MQVWSSWVWSRLPTPKPGEGLAAEPGILARSPNERPLPRKGAPCSGKGREDATEGACRGLSGAVSPQGQVWPCWEVWGGPGICLCRWGELHSFPCSLARSQAMAGPATDPGFLEPGGEDLGIRGSSLG